MERNEGRTVAQGRNASICYFILFIHHHALLRLNYYVSYALATLLNRDSAYRALRCAGCDVNLNFGHFLHILTLVEQGLPFPPYSCRGRRTYRQSLVQVALKRR